MFRGAITLYMTITGVVYATLLRPFEADLGLVEPWINRVLHALAPAALIDWLLFPPDRKLARPALWIWLTFPAAFLVVTLIRAQIADFYPYPFLDPREISYPGVIAYSAGILAVFLAVGAFLRWWGDERSSRPGSCGALPWRRLTLVHPIGVVERRGRANRSALLPFRLRWVRRLSIGPSLLGIDMERL